MLVLKYAARPTLAALVEAMQKKKGHHFCALSFSILKDGIGIDPSPFEPYQAYEPIEEADGLPSRIGFELKNMPDRVEHFLQEVRNSFPGIGFDELYVQVKLDRLWVIYPG